jgi:hypothetical protein
MTIAHFIAALRVERFISLGHASPEGFCYDIPAHERHRDYEAGPGT